MCEIDYSRVVREVDGKRTGMYNTWLKMRQRCNNPNHHKYHLYGARGISVIPEWEDFAQFAHDMGYVRPEGKTLDRVEVNGNYCKGNCRWATPLEQANNMRTNRKITYKGIEYSSIVALARAFGMSANVVYSRLEKGMTIEEVVETPLNSSHYVEYRGEAFSSLKHLAQHLGIPHGDFTTSVSKGMSVDEALEDYRERKTKRQDNQTVRELAEYLGLNCEALQYRRRKGMTVEQAVEDTLNHTYLYKGVRYPSRTALGRAFNISPDVIKARLDRGLPLRDAVELPVGSIRSFNKEYF